MRTIQLEALCHADDVRNMIGNPVGFCPIAVAMTPKIDGDTMMRRTQQRTEQVPTMG
jgi:hypothetical protein